MIQKEKIMIYEYFLSKINKLECDYITLNNNMRVKSYKLCDEVDFLELMLIKSQLDYTLQIFYEFKTMLNL